MGTQPSQSLVTYQEGLEHVRSCSSLSSRGLCLPSLQQASHVPSPLLSLSMSWHPGPIACVDHGQWTVAVKSNGKLTDTTQEYLTHYTDEHRAPLQAQ